MRLGVTLLLVQYAVAGTLYEQSISRVFEERFNRPDVAYLVLDSQSGEVIASHWRDPDQPIPLGSLTKPLLALTYANLHAGKYPRYKCDSRRCWLPAGHGILDVTHAIAFSCNSYFLQLGARMHRDDVASYFERAGLPVPPAQSGPRTWIGLGPDWKVPPLALARAIDRMSADPYASLVLSGMRLSARSGTGKLAKADALIKTGTAPCSHGRSKPGDGYVVALYPADRPQWTVMVQVHGVPGAQAAVTAGEMLRVLREGK